LQRERFLLRFAIHLAACFLFLTICRELGSRISVRSARIVIFKHSGTSDAGADGNQTALSPPEIEEHKTNDQIGATGSFDLRPHGALVVDGKFPEPSLSNLTMRFKHGTAPPLPGMPKFDFWPAIVDLLAYGAITGLAHSVYFYRRFRERERRALALESTLAQAKLNALKSQLQPHFLFNSLNAVVAQLRRNPAGAEATLVSLSELLRMALSFSERQEISVQEELAFVRRYVEIQKTRFGDKLNYREQIDDAARDCLLPTLTLQPLVENAIRHGIEPSETPGSVLLAARRNGDRLSITVEDDGVGLNGNASTPGAGIGLKNLRARLETLYRADQKLEIAPLNGSGSGVRVRLEIPLRRIAMVTETPPPPIAS
jgi:hypothetical protein